MRDTFVDDIWGNRDAGRMKCKCKDLEAGAVDQNRSQEEQAWGQNCRRSGKRADLLGPCRRGTLTFCSCDRGGARE